MHRRGGDSDRMQKRDAVFLKLARRHLIPKRDSVADLTFRLRTKPQEVEMQAAQACRLPRDSALLRNLSDAVKAPLAYRRLILPGLALLIFRDYYRKHGRIPRRDELKDLTERVWRKSISARQWRRVLHDDGLEELFAPIKG